MLHNYSTLGSKWKRKWLFSSSQYNISNNPISLSIISHYDGIRKQGQSSGKLSSLAPGFGWQEWQFCEILRSRQTRQTFPDQAFIKFTQNLVLNILPRKAFRKHRSLEGANKENPFRAQHLASPELKPWPRQTPAVSRQGTEPSDEVEGLCRREKAERLQILQHPCSHSC